MFISSTFAEVTETFLLVRKGTRGISYNIHMYGILRLFCICEVMFTALSYFGKFWICVIVGTKVITKS